MDLLTQNPLVLLCGLCLFSPPGLLWSAAIWLVARRYNIRNPFTPRITVNATFEGSDEAI